MLPHYLDDLCEAWEPVGSRITCNPPPTDTDQDILVLVSNVKYPLFLNELKESGWKRDGKETVCPKPSDFSSWHQYTVANEKWNEEEDKYGEMAVVDGEAIFNSWRKEDFNFGEINIILTLSEEWYDKFLEASNVCKALNVLDKKERIAIFDRVVPKEIKKEIKKEEKNSHSIMWMQSNLLINQLNQQSQSNQQAQAMNQQSQVSNPYTHPPGTFMIFDDMFGPTYGN